MGMLDGILQNPAVQKLAFGKLADLIKEKDLAFIAIDLDDKGEIRIMMYGKSEGYDIVKLNETISDPPGDKRVFVQGSMTVVKDGKEVSDAD